VGVLAYELLAIVGGSRDANIGGNGGGNIFVTDLALSTDLDSTAEVFTIGRPPAAGVTGVVFAELEDAAAFGRLSKLAVEVCSGADGVEVIAGTDVNSFSGALFTPSAKELVGGSATEIFSVTEL